MRTLRQSFELTPAMQAAVDPSVQQPTTNFTYVIKSTKAMYKICSHVINYQHVSIASAIIIGLALQEYKEYNSLPYRIFSTTHCYNKCLKH
jgi:hypothetical protein